ncbi:MAG: flavodoxin family protein [Firmicutes bacterium]|nr:flavodoxin family protein [Bacillota bacterium]
MRSCQINVAGAVPLKVSVIYDTRTGNTAQAAEWIAEGARRAGAEAACFKTDAVDEEFVKASSAVIIGSPTYMSLMTADLHRWLQEKAGKLGLAGKLGGAFATEQYTHGGAELVIQSILEAELVFGMVTYSSGSSQGRPCIHIGPVGVNGNIESHNGMEHYRTYFELFGERMARKAFELFG